MCASIYPHSVPEPERDNYDSFRESITYPGRDEHSDTYPDFDGHPLPNSNRVAFGNPEPLSLDDFDSWTDEQRIAYSRAVSNTYDPSYLDAWLHPEREPVIDTYVIRPLTESDLDYKRITNRYFDAYPDLLGFLDSDRGPGGSADKPSA